MVSSYTVALVLHIVGVLLFVSGFVLAGATFETARRRQEPKEIALILRLTRIGVLLVGVGSMVVLGFGLWLVDLGNFGYGAGWVDASLALFVLAVLLGGVGGQRPKRARLLASRLASERVPANAELRALMNDRFSLAVNYISAVLVLAILALMVFKP